MFGFILSLLCIGFFLCVLLVIIVGTSHWDIEAKLTCIVTSLLIIMFTIITCLVYTKVKDEIYTQAINDYQIGDVYKTPDGTWHHKFVDYD